MEDVIKHIKDRIGSKAEVITVDSKLGVCRLVYSVSGKKFECRSSKSYVGIHKNIEVIKDMVYKGIKINSIEDIWEYGGNIYVITPVCDGSTLREFVKSNDISYKKIAAKNIAREIYKFKTYKVDFLEYTNFSEDTSLFIEKMNISEEAKNKVINIILSYPESISYSHGNLNSNNIILDKYGEVVCIKDPSDIQFNYMPLDIIDILEEALKGEEEMRMEFTMEYKKLTEDYVSKHIIFENYKENLEVYKYLSGEI